MLLEENWLNAICRTLVQTSSVGAIVCDLRGHVLGGTRAVARWLGLRPDQLVGCMALDFVDPEDRVLCRDTLAQLLYAGEDEADLEIRLIGNHGTRWVRLHGRLERSDGSPKLVALLVDTCDYAELVEAQAAAEDSPVTDRCVRAPTCPSREEPALWRPRISRRR